MRRLVPILVGFVVGSLPGTILFQESAVVHDVSAPGTHETPAAFLEPSQLVVTRWSADYEESALLVIEPSSADAHVSSLPFSRSAFQDKGAAWSSTLRTLYFASGRDGAGFDDPWNLWSVARSEAGWGEPEPLPAPVNSDGHECCPALGAGGWLYFSSNRAGTWDIYRTRLRETEFAEVEPLTALNTEHGEWPSYVAPDGAFLLMSSIRPDGLGGDDLYIAHRDSDGRFGPPMLLPAPVNSEAYEDSGMMSPDGRTLWFSSARRTRFSDDDSNVYRMSIDGTPALRELFER